MENNTNQTNVNNTNEIAKQNEIFLDILKSLEGVNETDNTPNGIVGLTNQIVTIKNGKVEDEKSFSEMSNYESYKPEIKVNVRGKYVEVKLIFFSAYDPELNILFNHLEQYSKKCDELYKNNIVDKDIVSILTLTSVVYRGSRFVNFVNPIFWTKEPSINNRTDNNAIKILYEVENMTFYKMPDEFDLDALEESFKREENDKEMMVAKKEENTIDYQYKG